MRSVRRDQSEGNPRKCPIGEDGLILTLSKGIARTFVRPKCRPPLRGGFHGEVGDYIKSLH